MLEQFLFSKLQVIVISTYGGMCNLLSNPTCMVAVH